MGKIRKTVTNNSRVVFWSVIAAVSLLFVMLYKLGSLVGGLSGSEMSSSAAVIGWHGIYHDSLYLPLKLIRSADYSLISTHGQTLTRLPNVIFGLLSVISFGYLIKLWHGTRTAIMATILFATSAWVLHVSRLASFDVLYLWAMPTLLLLKALTYRYVDNGWVWYLCLIAWGLMIYVPGLIWLVLLSLYLSRNQVKQAWKHFGSSQKLIYVGLALLWLPLLAYDLVRFGGALVWIGLPDHFLGYTTSIKHFLAVPVHLFIRGPQYAELWLDKSPILDIFTLAMCIIGMYFYVIHWKSSRTRLLVAFAGVSAILVGLSGPVGLSLLVPLLYIVAATGIAYIVHEWLKVFPVNPLARTTGILLVCVAISLSCLYNLRAYFIAWPHNQSTKTVFRYHR